MTPEPQFLSVLTPGQLLPASVALEPPALAFTLEPLVLTFVNLQPLVPALVLLGQLLLGSAPLEPLVLPFRNREPPALALVLLEPLLLRSVPPEPLPLEPLLLAHINLKNLPAVKKNRSSSSPTGASSQIAPPGRSGIILRGKSKFFRCDH